MGKHAAHPHNLRGWAPATTVSTPAGRGRHDTDRLLWEQGHCTTYVMVKFFGIPDGETATLTIAEPGGVLPVMCHGPTTPGQPCVCATTDVGVAK